MIQAVILAGGLGTRMRPHTETVAKPMLPVLGRPFLEHQVALLRASGIRQYLFLVGYLGEQIESHFGTGSRYNAVIRYSYESSPLGTGGALRNAASSLDADFLLLNGDTLLGIDYLAFADFFRNQRHAALIAAFPKAAPERGNLHVAENGLVIGYSKQNPRGAHVDAGVIALRREAVDLIPGEGKSSLEEEVYPKLIARGEMRAFPATVPFFDMGTPAGLAALEEHLR